MLAKLAAFLPSLAIGTMSLAEFLSRARLAIGHPAAGAAANLASALPECLSAFVRADARLYGSALGRILHIAFAPAQAALSLLAAGGRLAGVIIADVAHVAPLYLMHML